MDKQNCYIDYLEWEVLDNKVVIQHLESQGNLYHFNDTYTVTIFRDDDYKLKGILEGQDAINSDLLFPSISKGEMTFGETILGIGNDGFTYILKGMIIDTYNVMPNIDDLSRSSFKANLSIASITKSKKQVPQFNKVQYWYLCSKHDIPFPATTQRTNNPQFPKQRMGLDEECSIEKMFIPGGTYQTSRDYLPISLSDKQIIVLSKVPQLYLPQQANGLCIECRENFGGIPDDKEILAATELLSFVIGTQMTLVGISYYKDHDFLCQISISPSISNLQQKLQQVSEPPIDCHHYANYQTFISAIFTLMPQYLQKREVLQLNYALAHYWIAKDAPIGVNLPILSSALEAIASASLKDLTNDRQQSTYMPAKEYRNLIKDEVEKIKAKLEEKNVVYRQKILNKIDGAYNMGGNEKIDLLFDRFGIIIGPLEKEALKARNLMAHGTMKTLDYERYKEIIRKSYAYRTLFHRVILKILSYNGEYIDYYTYGYPSRNIDDPIPTE